VFYKVAYLRVSRVEVLVGDFPGLRVERDAVRDDLVLSDALDEPDVVGAAGEGEADLLPVPGRAVARGLDAHAEATHAPELVALVQEERVRLALVARRAGHEFLEQ